MISRRKKAEEETFPRNINRRGVELQITGIPKQETNQLLEPNSIYVHYDTHRNQ